MEIILGKKPGFCPGVTNVVRKIQRELENTKKLYCVGEIMQDQTVIQDLKQKGLQITDTMEKVPKGEKAIICAHGITKQEYEIAKNKELTLLDLTCPQVIQIHKQAQNYANNGYYILVLGEKEHKEVIGTTSFCGKHVGNIATQNDVMQEVEKINKGTIRNVAILSQTTFSILKFDLYVERIKRSIAKSCNMEINKTICDTTRAKQQEASQIARQSELVIVLGDKKSANTQQLYEIALEICSNAMQVETIQDLYMNYVRRFEKIGILTEASAKEEMIQEVVKKIKETKIEDKVI